MTTTTDIDPVLDAIDWDAPTSFLEETHQHDTPAHQNPALYEFITTAAELIPDDADWQRFTAAFDRLERLRGRP